MEGLPWILLEHDSNRIVFESSPIPKLAIRIIRDIEIPRDGQQVVIKNRIERYAPNPFPVQVWSITQIKIPAYCFMEIPSPLSPATSTFVSLLGRDSAELIAAGRFLRHTPLLKGETAKTGTLGSWVAAIFPDGLILLQYIDVKHGACYPDSASVEAYSDKNCMEIETLGEQRHLMPGEALECKVIWTIVQCKDFGDDQQLKQINKAVQEIKKVHTL